MNDEKRRPAPSTQPRTEYLTLRTSDSAAPARTARRHEAGYLHFTTRAASTNVYSIPWKRWNFNLNREPRAFLLYLLRVLLKSVWSKACSRAIVGRIGRYMRQLMLRWGIAPAEKATGFELALSGHHFIRLCGGRSPSLWKLKAAGHSVHAARICSSIGWTSTQFGAGQPRAGTFLARSANSASAAPRRPRSPLSCFLPYQRE